MGTDRQRERERQTVKERDLQTEAGRGKDLIKSDSDRREDELANNQMTGNAITNVMRVFQYESN